jgi:phenylacetate-CoA ligase
MKQPTLLPLRSAVEGLAWPPVQVGPAASLAALVSAFDASQWLSADELAARALKQLELLARHAAHQSPLFARRLSEAGLSPADLGCPGGLARLPPITRRAVQAAGEAFHCATVPKTHMPVGDLRTSGSTGEPLTVRRTSISNLMWMANSIRDHLWRRRDFSARIATIRANLVKVARTDDWGPPASLVFRTGAGLGLPIGLPLAKQASELRAFRPGSLLSYPNNLDVLIDALAEGGGPWPELKHVRTISETVSPRLRERARAYFGLEIEDTYSAQEAGVIALQCPDCGQYHVMAETVIVEVVDAAGRPCGPGEVGRALVTDVTNFASPIVRYEIGDYAEMGGTASCGRGLPTLGRILGRERNLILMPDGTRRWPLTGYHRFRAIAPILQFQFVQTGRETIEVNLVTARPLSEQEEAALRLVIAEALGYPFAIAFRYHEGALPRGENGKFEDFVCRVEA